jgi:hypothetical protein
MSTSTELRKRLAELEQAEGEATLAGVCEVVGIGLRAVQSRERTAETARKRAVVAWVLCDRLGWPQRRTAAALGRTVRQVQAMLRAVR